jgi:hypothetical protein
MTRMDCEHVVDYLNGTLSDEENLGFEEHLKTCADCQQIVELTGDLPYLAEPVDPPAGMKSRILANVLEEDRKEEGHPETKPAAVPIKRAAKRNWWTSLIAAALLLSLLGNAYAFFRLSEPEEQETALQQVDLQANEAFEGAAKAKLIRNDRSLDIMVAAEQLEELEGDEVYQVWLLRDGQPIPAGAFTPNPSGEGAAYFSLEQNTEGWDTIAVTREPQVGNESPQGDIVLSSEI